MAGGAGRSGAWRARASAPSRLTTAARGPSSPWQKSFRRKSHTDSKGVTGTKSSLKAFLPRAARALGKGAKRAKAAAAGPCRRDRYSRRARALGSVVGGARSGDRRGRGVGCGASASSASAALLLADGRRRVGGPGAPDGASRALHARRSAWAAPLLADERRRVGGSGAPGQRKPSASCSLVSVGSTSASRRAAPGRRTGGAGQRKPSALCSLVSVSRTSTSSCHFF